MESDKVKTRSIRSNHKQTKPNYKSAAKPKNGPPTQSLREIDVGITEYVGKHAGFKGIVKSRYSDFHVNEIDLTGKVLHLNNLEVPKPSEKVIEDEFVESIKKDLIDIISAEKWQEIDDMINKKERQVIEIDVTAVDKQRRTNLHELLKKLYGKKIISNTINKAEDTKCITLKYDDKKKGDNRTRWTFGGEHVHFLVYKENIDTAEVASNLASNLKMRPSLVNFCGTKDKRAITTQQFSVKRRHPSEILNAKRHMKNVKIGNFEFKNYPLRLGMLKGNRFRIVIRHLEDEQSQIDACLEEVRQHGFINYYGMQRFGNNAAVPTYEIGVALLKCDYKLVCELILKPRANDTSFMAPIRELWYKERDSAKALAMFPKFSKNNLIEKSILEGLTQYGENDYCAAIKKLSRNSLLMYPHSFQSLVFNLVVSRRIKEFGMKVLKGDLVIAEEEDLTPKTDEEATEMDVDVFDKCDMNIKKVRVLEEADIERGNITIFDIVLCLPGYDIVYPANITASYYEEILEKFGITKEHLCHKIKSLSMPGAYRKMLLKPEDVSWQYVYFDDMTESSLIKSDWDVLCGKDTPMKTSGKYRALVLEYNLASSTYATMLLRELLRSDTSASAQSCLEETVHEKQKTLNEAAEKRKAETNMDENLPDMTKKSKNDEI